MGESHSCTSRRRYPREGFVPLLQRGPRASRGDVRAAALILLAEELRNRYQLMQEIEQRSGGLWRLSAGEVYPALAQLEDEGLVRVEERDGRRTCVLTDAGRAYENAVRRDRTSRFGALVFSRSAPYCRLTRLLWDFFCGGSWEES